MKVILRGGLAQGTAPREIQLSPGRAITREELVAALAERVPVVQRYLAMRAETGRAPSLLILAGGAWVSPGDLVPEDATIEIHPPIAGGQAERA